MLENLIRSMGIGEEHVVIDTTTNTGEPDDIVKVIMESNSEEKNQELLRNVTKIAQYTGKGEEKK